MQKRTAYYWTLFYSVSPFSSIPNKFDKPAFFFHSPFPEVSDWTNQIFRSDLCLATWPTDVARDSHIAGGANISSGGGRNGRKDDTEARCFCHSRRAELWNFPENFRSGTVFSPDVMNFLVFAHFGLFRFFKILFPLYGYCFFPDVKNTLDFFPPIFGLFPFFKKEFVWIKSETIHCSISQAAVVVEERVGRAAEKHLKQGRMMWWPRKKQGRMMRRKLETWKWRHLLKVLLTENQLIKEILPVRIKRTGLISNIIESAISLVTVSA